MESDQTSLYHTAKGLMTLQALYGTIPQIFGKGECARVRQTLLLKQCLLFYLILCFAPRYSTFVLSAGLSVEYNA